MSTYTLHLIAPDCAAVAVATVADTGEHFTGTIDLAATPSAVRAVFEEYEEIVLGQMFSFLDEIESKVAALDLRAEWEGAAVPIKDLQVYPTSGEVSFKLAVPAARTHGS